MDHKQPHTADKTSLLHLVILKEDLPTTGNVSINTFKEIAENLGNEKTQKDFIRFEGKNIYTKFLINLVSKSPDIDPKLINDLILFERLIIKILKKYPINEKEERAMKQIQKNYFDESIEVILEVLGQESAYSTAQIRDEIMSIELPFKYKDCLSSLLFEYTIGELFGATPIARLEHPSDGMGLYWKRRQSQHQENHNKNK